MTAIRAPLHRLLLVTFAVGVVGTGTELLLLGHTEDIWQLVPLVLLGVGLAVSGWFAAAPTRASLAAFRGMMGLFAAGGATGLFLHYRGNAEFELEMVPGLGGTALFREAMTGATPALAPGAMILLALIGLACTLQHPARGAALSHDG